MFQTVLEMSVIFNKPEKKGALISLSLVFLETDVYVIILSKLQRLILLTLCSQLFPGILVSRRVP